MSYVAQVPDADPFGGADDPFGGDGMAPVQAPPLPRPLLAHRRAAHARLRCCVGGRLWRRAEPALLSRLDTRVLPELLPLTLLGNILFFECGKQAPAAHGSMDDMFGGGDESAAPADDIFGGTMQGNLMNSPPRPAEPAANGMGGRGGWGVGSMQSILVASYFVLYTVCVFVFLCVCV